MSFWRLVLRGLCTFVFPSFRTLPSFRDFHGHVAFFPIYEVEILPEIVDGRVIGIRYAGIGCGIFITAVEERDDLDWERYLSLAQEHGNCLELSYPGLDVDITSPPLQHLVSHDVLQGIGT